MGNLDVGWPVCRLIDTVTVVGSLSALATMLRPCRLGERSALHSKLDLALATASGAHGRVDPEFDAVSAAFAAIREQHLAAPPNANQKTLDLEY